MSAIGLNQLIRTDIYATYSIKVIGKASGKIEYSTILANTASATPVYYLTTPLSFSPASGDLYEISCGIVYIIGVTTAGASQTRFYSTAINAFGNM